MSKCVCLHFLDINYLIEVREYILLHTARESVLV